jgi:hypothetical protein
VEVEVSEPVVSVSVDTVVVVPLLALVVDVVWVVVLVDSEAVVVLDSDVVWVSVVSVAQIMQEVSHMCICSHVGQNMFSHGLPGRVTMSSQVSKQSSYMKHVVDVLVSVVLVRVRPVVVVPVVVPEVSEELEVAVVVHMGCESGVSKHHSQCSKLGLLTHTLVRSYSLSPPPQAQQASSAAL